MDKPTYTVIFDFDNPNTEMVFNQPSGKVQFPKRIYGETSFEILLQLNKSGVAYSLASMTSAKAYVKVTNSILLPVEISTGATTINPGEVEFVIDKDVIPNEYSGYTVPGNNYPITLYVVIESSDAGKISLETNIQIMDIDRDGTEEAIEFDGAEITYDPEQPSKWTIQYGTAPISVSSALDKLARISRSDYGLIVDAITTPVVTPTDGQKWLVIATGTGAFVGKENSLMEWNAELADYIEHTPNEGEEVYNVATNLRIVYNGSAWVTAVDYYGATMNADTNVSANSWVIDEDTMVSDLATKVPTQQSVKAYVDTEIAGALTSSLDFKGGYDANTNTPDLDTTPSGVLKGDVYVVSVAGTFFTTLVEVGDTLLAKVDNATIESDWVINQANLTAATIKTQYESNADTNAFTDAEQTKLGHIAVTQAVNLDTIESDVTLLQGSGVLTGGVLSIGTGGAGVATTFTIASGTGVIVDNTVNPPTKTPVSWSTQTDVAVTNILTNLVTFVAIDSGGSVIQSTTDFTPSQMRQYIVIGVVVHSNLTTVNAVNQAQIVAYNTGNQFTDLLYSMGLFNVSGNLFSANGANLKLNKSAGSLFRRGANYSSLSSNPHLVTTGSLTQASLRMQNQTGAGSASTTDVDVANYDLAGVTTAISPATRFSILRVFLFQSNLVAVQRGQATYQSLAEAKAAIQTETYITNDVLLANGLLRGFIVAQANATSLSDASKVFFIEAGKFGGSSGVGGLSVSTLQNAYDNSSSPEILTDATRGALTIRRGSGADTDNILEGLNNASSTTFEVDGNGQITSASLTASEIVLTDASKNLVSGAVATYPSLTELAYVKGVTSAVQTQINDKLAIQHYRNILIPANAFSSAITNGARAVQVEKTTNKNNFDGYDFDAATIQYIHTNIPFPDDWDLSTIKAKFHWSDGDTAGTGDVIWGIQGIAVSNDDALDVAYGTAQEVTDTFIATGDNHVTSATGACTIGGTPALDDLIQLRVYRDAADGSDTYTQKARLVAVSLQYRTKTTVNSAW